MEYEEYKVWAARLMASKPISSVHSLTGLYHTTGGAAEFRTSATVGVPAANVYGSSCDYASLGKQFLQQIGRRYLLLPVEPTILASPDRGPNVDNAPYMISLDTAWRFWYAATGSVGPRPVLCQYTGSLPKPQPVWGPETHSQLRKTKRDGFASTRKILR